MKLIPLLLLFLVSAAQCLAYYNPSTGRWLSRDPIDEPGRRLISTSDGVGLVAEINDFSFAANDGVNFFDMLGLACGSSWNDPLVPDRPQGFDFQPACSAHDACYGCSGKSAGKTKSDCDLEFLAAMRQVCMSVPTSASRSVPNPNRRGKKEVPYNPQQACLGLAQTYFNAVDRLGQSAFNKARKCCP